MRDTLIFLAVNILALVAVIVRLFGTDKCMGRWGRRRQQFSTARFIVFQDKSFCQDAPHAPRQGERLSQQKTQFKTSSEVGQYLSCSCHVHVGNTTFGMAQPCKQIDSSRGTTRSAPSPAAHLLGRCKHGDRFRSAPSSAPPFSGLPSHRRDQLHGAVFVVPSRQESEDAMDDLLLGRKGATDVKA